VGVSDTADPFDIKDIVLRIRDDLTKERFGLWPDCGLPLGEVMGIINERDLNTHLGHRVMQQVVGAAI